MTPSVGASGDTNPSDATGYYLEEKIRNSDGTDIFRPKGKTVSVADSSGRRGDPSWTY